jgi:hypothetical protein
MMGRMTLLLVGLLMTGFTAAAENPSAPLSVICPGQTALTRSLAVRSVFAAPPAMNALIVNVIDGKLPQVRQQLDTMDSVDGARWRQSALVIAAYARDPAMVAGLLDDGALVDGQGMPPALDSKFRDQLLAEVKKDPKWATLQADPKTARDLDALFLFDGRSDGPVATIAAQCDDLATLDVALGHHANVKARVPGSNDVMVMAVMANNPVIVKRLLDHGVDPADALGNSSDGLVAAIAEGNASMVTLLLDNGADPCAEYRTRQLRLNTYAAEHHERKRTLPTDAAIGRRKSLPDDLVARLTCPALDPGH